MRVSLDNGNTFLTAEEAWPEIEERHLLEALVQRMEDDVREAVHDALAPCTGQDFLAAYLEAARYDLILG